MNFKSNFMNTADKMRLPQSQELNEAYDDVWYLTEQGHDSKSVELCEARLKLHTLRHQDRINSDYYDSDEEIERALEHLRELEDELEEAKGE